MPSRGKVGGGGACAHLASSSIVSPVLVVPAGTIILAPDSRGDTWDLTELQASPHKCWRTLLLVPSAQLPCFPACRLPSLSSESGFCFPAQCSCPVKHASVDHCLTVCSLQAPWQSAKHHLNRLSYDLQYFGPDIDFIDRALNLTFGLYNTDIFHLGVEGFSDGATYALSIGEGCTSLDQWPQLQTCVSNHMRSSMMQPPSTWQELDAARPPVKKQKLSCLRQTAAQFCLPSTLTSLLAWRWLEHRPKHAQQEEAACLQHHHILLPLPCRYHQW